MRHVILAAAAFATLAPASALAGTASLSLVRGSLTNVSDAAGIWQIEGGQVFAASGRQVGDYACTRRTVTSVPGTITTVRISPTGTGSPGPIWPRASTRPSASRLSQGAGSPATGGSRIRRVRVMPQPAFQLPMSASLPSPPSRPSAPQDQTSNWPPWAEGWRYW